MCPYHTILVQKPKSGISVTTCCKEVAECFKKHGGNSLDTEGIRRLSDSIKDQDRTATTPVVGMVPDQPSFPPWRHRPHVVEKEFINIYKIYQDHPDPFRDESPILIPLNSMNEQLDHTL